MIAIVTDSTCDLPEKLALEAGIHVVPAYINIGRQTLRDGIDITREAFYKWLPQMPGVPTTSAPSPGTFAELYETLLEKANQVVSIHVASKLSGICNAARLAAQQVSNARIHVLDSGQVSMGLGWAALAAATTASQSATLEGVLHSAQDTLQRVRVYALLNTLEFLSRSGRVSMVQLGLSSLLSIKPMIELRDGIVSSLGRVRTWSRAVKALADQSLRLAPLERLAVMHTNRAECAQEFMERLKGSLPRLQDALIVNATTVIGAHVGPDALGIAAVLRDKV